MIRGTPPRHGLQDMLVRSVETPSSDVMVASPRSNGELVYRSIAQPHESFQRGGLAGRRVSPPRRQTIIVDDGSPQVKRRRVIEDDYGQFRPMPSREPDRYITVGYGQEPAPHREVIGVREPVASYHSSLQSQTQRQRDYQPYPADVCNDIPPRSAAVEDRSYRPAQHDYGSGNHMHRPFLIEHESAMRLEPGPVIEEPFIDRFSQARLEPFSRDRFSVTPNERPQHLPFNPSHYQHSRL